MIIDAAPPKGHEQSRVIMEKELTQIGQMTIRIKN